MGGCLGFIAILIMLSIIGWVIDMIVPGRMPYGWLGGIVAAIIGGLLGGIIFGSWGPSAEWSGWHLSFVPALLGGILFGFIVRFVMSTQTRRTL
jgi:uncharacterized membrane protein YeaQ/YmgE (transglycosylase-associated protein family)